MNLLLLEDDHDLGRAVADHCSNAGHVVHWCRQVAEAWDAPPPDLALIDLHLPDGDGLDLLRLWRGAGQLWPVIVLTARDQVSDRIRGLNAGADDYLVKPFDLDELLARVLAVARRTAPAAAAGSVGGLRLDTDAHQAWLDGAPVDLTQMEWAVLACLAQRPGRIFSRGEIEGRLQALGLAEASSNSLEVIVSRLRKKLGGGLISTHRGLGYRLER
ncbi:response regulator transcription factor [Pseudaquabacterium pictum]|nr:response regulator transcription factor [Rubrivivax pictus]